MSFLYGVRVVRGPDWKWDDQDGGEGNVGTVIDTPDSEWKQFGPRTVTVVWDSGIKAQYRSGPTGSFDLRVIDNASTGVKHYDYPCRGIKCCDQGIMGIRWQCITCSINLCSTCFFNEIPHDPNHDKFKRFENSQISTEPITVSSWSTRGPESRIQLKGLYPGAEVVQGPKLLHEPRNYEMSGMVLPNEELLIEWMPGSIRRIHQRGLQDLLMIEPGIGGYYHPNALPVLVFQQDLLFSPPTFDLKRWQIPLTALHIACKEGQRDVLSFLLRGNQVDLEAANESGLKAIHFAVLGCDLGILELLFKCGAQMDCRTFSGQTALHMAVAKQFPKCLRRLIRCGCDVNIQDFEGDTPLHDAISGGRTPEIIRILAASGRIHWKLRNNTGLNVLQLAVLKNDFKAIEIILENVVDHMDLLLEPMAKSTVLHYACFHRNFEVAQILLDLMKTSPVHLKIFLEAKNQIGWTAFLLSCYQKDYALMELLFEAGADVMALDRNENSALMIALSTLDFSLPSKEQCPSIYEVQSFVKMMQQYPALGIVGYLLDKGCDWSKKNLFDSNPIRYLQSCLGYPRVAINILSRFATKCRKRFSYSASPCYLKKDPYLKLPKSYLENDPIEEYVTLDDRIVSKQLDESFQEVEELSDYVLEWMDDGSMYGSILDQFGNKYEYQQLNWAEKGELFYRCNREGPLYGMRRCCAFVQRIVNSEGIATMRLADHHGH